MIDVLRRQYLIHRINNNSLYVESGCREWQGTKNNKGYGLVHFAIKNGDGYKSSIPAHRAHYMAFYNVVLKRNELVCHKCDNPACVEIEHLFLGSQKENMADMDSKGRRVYNPEWTRKKRLRIYTDEQIIAIRNETGLLKFIADKYGVSQSYVSKLRNMKAKALV